MANNRQIELGFDNPNETDEWFGAFASVIPVAQASLLLAQQQAALGSAAQGPPQLESSTIEGAIAIHAHYRARVQFGRSVLLQEPPAEEISRAVLGPHQAAPHMVAVLNCVAALQNGAVFRKLKRGSSAKRLIWCDSMLSAVMWGSEDRREVKGFLRTSDIREVRRGQGNDEIKIDIVTPARVLELECRDAAQAQEWHQLFQFLVASNQAEAVQKKALFQQYGLDSSVQKYAQEYSHLLVNGDFFKKWPSIRSRGSSTHRRIVATPNIDRINWCDGSSGKILGFIPIRDVIEIREDPAEPLKFTVQAQKRALVLEASSPAVKASWIRAITFFVEFRQKE